MKKLLFTSALLAVIASCFVLLSFTKPANNIKVSTASAPGTLYVKIKADGNKGSMHVVIRSASGNPKLADLQLAAGQTFEKTFTGLAHGPQSWYVVSFDWPGTDFHNMAAGTGSMIATGFPVTGGNMVGSWQVAGTGAFGSVPVLLP